MTDTRDMTPYERGYLAGKSGITEGEDPNEDSYYEELSRTDRLDYDFGYIDGLETLVETLERR